MGFIIGSMLRRYWQYFALAALVLLSVTLARKNGKLNAEINRAVSRIEALKQKEVVRREVRSRTDDQLVAGIVRPKTKR
jgi:hypothetical protein